MEYFVLTKVENTHSYFNKNIYVFNFYLNLKILMVDFIYNFYLNSKQNYFLNFFSKYNLRGNNEEVSRSNFIKLKKPHGYVNGSERKIKNIKSSRQ